MKATACICPCLALAVLAGCHSTATGKQPLRIAVAADAAGAARDIGTAFTAQTGIPTVVVPGASGVLEQQIAGGAPYGVFLSADSSFVDKLIHSGQGDAASAAVYSHGTLVLVSRTGLPDVRTVRDLANARYQHISVANPAVAPYGAAAVQALHTAGIWPQVKSRVVYAGNVIEALQQVSTGNSDAAFTSLTLTINRKPPAMVVPAAQYRPIAQKMCVTKYGDRSPAALQWVKVLMSRQGTAILAAHGLKR
ncbi:MAG: molybdate ABC transporter substrate-binding protein [Armatimonadetes bacterium]|nr:molybdate ABC transporter substrate-binding protein [Armatimonadota bacterium]MDE2207389.1 molybdate ABC transporter substrate-binding protein [Armatimonadota bacterium]